MKFIANFRYEVRNNITNDPLKNQSNLVKYIKSTEGDTRYQFDSVCTETMIGFV
jgi:hypothetical protein